MKLCKGLWVVMLLSGISANSVATIMTFNDESAFQAAVTGTGNSVSVLDFDSTPVNTTIADGSTFQDIQFGFTDGSGSSFDGMVASGFDTSSGTQYLGYNDPSASALLSGDSVTMNFSQTIHAIGLFIIAHPDDFGFQDDAILSAGGTQISNPLAPAEILGDGGATYFMGIIDTDGFTLADLSTICCGFFEFNIDDIQFASFSVQDTPKIPEPSAIALLVFGALLVNRRRAGRSVTNP